jgi:hypothetical protein
MRDRGQICQNIFQLSQMTSARHRCSQQQSANLIFICSTVWQSGTWHITPKVMSSLTVKYVAWKSYCNKAIETSYYTERSDKQCFFSPESQ